MFDEVAVCRLIHGFGQKEQPYEHTNLKPKHESKFYYNTFHFSFCVIVSKNNGVKTEILRLLRN